MNLKDTSKRQISYANAIKRKYHNKSVLTAYLENGNFVLEIKNLLSKDKNEPAGLFKIERNIVAVDIMVITRETLEALIINSLELLNQLDETNNSKGLN